MNLGERKTKILQAVIDDYIKTAEPVGSRAIAKKHGLSAATIRNEMADLEEMGYLEKPHTSAGRVPSNLGYRYYVDALMQNYRMSGEEVRALRSALSSRIRELDRAFSEISDIISNLIHYTTIAATLPSSDATIKNLCLLPIDEYMAMLVLITGEDVVKNRVIRNKYGLSPESLEGISNILQREFSGISFSDVGKKINDITLAIFPHFELANEIFSFIRDCEQSCRRAEVFAGGAGNMLSFPEYSDIEKARNFLNFIDKKGNLSDILSMPIEEGQVKITIGGENRFREISDCSIVITNYSIGGKIGGKIGVIGPTRMDYARVVSSLRHIAESLEALFSGEFSGG